MLASKVFQISYLIGAEKILSVPKAMKAYFAANVPPILAIKSMEEVMAMNVCSALLSSNNSVSLFLCWS